MFHRERVEKEYAPQYTEFGLGTTIWSPLASCMLTGKYSRGVPEDARVALPEYVWLRTQFESDEGQTKINKVGQLQCIADELNATMAQLALAWCLNNPNVSTVITGASRPQQVTENMGALEVMPALTPAVLERIETVLDNKPAPERTFR